MYSEDVVEDARGGWPCKVSRRQLLKSVSVTLLYVKRLIRKIKIPFPWYLTRQERILLTFREWPGAAAHCVKITMSFGGGGEPNSHREDQVECITFFLPPYWRRLISFRYSLQGRVRKALEEFSGKTWPGDADLRAERGVSGIYWNTSAFPRSPCGFASGQYLFQTKKIIHERLFLKRCNEVSTVVCDFLGANYVWNKVMKMKEQ